MDYAATALADTTLDFDEAELQFVYNKVSRYIVGVHEDPVTTGFIVGSTRTHNAIVFPSFVIKRGMPSRVQYSNQTVALVDRIGQVNLTHVVLFARRNGEPLPPIEYAELDPSDEVCDKVVTLFPYMDGVALFKGNVVLKDCTSRRPEEESIQEGSHSFVFTCPYGVAYLMNRGDQQQRDLVIYTIDLNCGAAVFNLEGNVVGVLSDCGSCYDIKFATKASYIQEQILKLQGNQEVTWLKISPHPCDTQIMWEI